LATFFIFFGDRGGVGRVLRRSVCGAGFERFCSENKKDFIRINTGRRPVPLLENAANISFYGLAG
jgi:hypothetical protein